MAAQTKSMNCMLIVKLRIPGEFILIESMREAFGNT